MHSLLAPKVAYLVLQSYRIKFIPWYESSPNHQAFFISIYCQEPRWETSPSEFLRIHSIPQENCSLLYLFSGQHIIFLLYMCALAEPSDSKLQTSWHLPLNTSANILRLNHNPIITLKKINFNLIRSNVRFIFKFHKRLQNVFYALKRFIIPLGSSLVSGFLVSLSLKKF